MQSRYTCLPKFFSSPLPHSVVYESEPTSTVIYDIPSDVMADIGPDTSQNVAYGVRKKIITTPNPAYDVIQR